MDTERQARITAISHSGVDAATHSRLRLAAPSTANPHSTVARTVKPVSSRGASAVDSPVISPCGAIATPAASALRPCTDWTKTGSRNTAAQVRTEASAHRPMDRAGRGRPASDRSRAGCSRRAAQPA
jgi:hypothetical protein